MSMVLSVSQINNKIKNLLDNDIEMHNVLIKGEISNYKLHSSGHHYLTLKDETSSISAVFFKFDALKLKFRLENGMSIIAGGKISSFPKSGQYQLYIKDITEDGTGNLDLAFNQLKEKLYKEGLFDEKYKKSLPRFPRRVAVVTSKTGAVISDIVRVIRARYNLADIVLYPSAVQGDGAATEISKAIELINKHNTADVIICGRGGGSIEDLWAFNEEVLARTIFGSEIPIISAVGHAPDITIADFVADARAQTPSNAGEIAVPNVLEIRNFVSAVENKLINDIKNNISNKIQTLELLSQKLIAKSPEKYILDKGITVRNLSDKMILHMNNILNSKRNALITNISVIEAFNPLKVLIRGYTVCSDSAGKTIKSIKKIKKGDNINILFSDGIAHCNVERKSK